MRSCRRAAPSSSRRSPRTPAKIALVDRLPQPAFKAGEPGVALGELRRGQHREREQIAIIAVLLDLFLAQHGSVPTECHPGAGRDPLSCKIRRWQAGLT